VDKINKLRRISINTIVFGNESNNLTFMRQLAERNRGEFIHVK
jgi:predicted nucleotidyltransferase